ncbi:MAG: Crp/Fnr family transcriptional regulator [Chitinophagaceae bacterium]|nr:Crp/Fnr family transcriptional regulator [Rubrivivax sp.]
MPEQGGRVGALPHTGLCALRHGGNAPKHADCVRHGLANHPGAGTRRATRPPLASRHRKCRLANAQNHLIALLPRVERERLLAICQPVDLVLAQVLCERGEPTRHVYFPTIAFISLIAQLDEYPGLEVGMVGREGMVGVHMTLGVSREPLRAVVQGEGQVLQVSAAPFRALLLDSPALRRLLQRYTHVLMAQRAASAACLRFHPISPRLARWLLMSQDRAHTDEFAVTQEFLAYMLGVRRVGVTMAAGDLQRAGLIEYQRGNLKVVDRSGLEAAACSCYAADQQTYVDGVR